MVINVELKNRTIMKKTYITPSMETIKIELQHMIAVSSTGINLTDEVIDAQDEDAVSDGMSRGFDWFDED